MNGFMMRVSSFIEGILMIMFYNHDAVYALN